MNHGLFHDQARSDSTMPFSRLVLERLSPCLERLENVIKASGRFHIRELGVWEDGPQVFLSGIWAELRDAQRDGVALNLGLTVHGFFLEGWDVPEFGVKVGWSRTGTPGETSWAVMELTVRPMRLAGQASVDRLSRQLPHCEQALRAALRRGCPPPSWLTWIRRTFGRIERP
jgi:hypothetical protein